MILLSAYITCQLFNGFLSASVTCSLNGSAINIFYMSVSCGCCQHLLFACIMGLLSASVTWDFDGFAISIVACLFNQFTISIIYLPGN